MSAQASPYKVHSREITQKASKGEQPFLHATHRLDPIYMPTKYYQNISKGIKVIERTSFCLRTDRRTDRRTDGQTDGRQADRYIPRSFSGRGIMTPSCCMIVDRIDHVQHLQFQRAIPDGCICSLTEQNSDKRL